MGRRFLQETLSLFGRAALRDHQEARGEVHLRLILGLPLGPAQPAALLEAMGSRKDWEDLRIFGALVTVLSDVFTHPKVHYLSGFFGPLEPLLRRWREVGLPAAALADAGLTPPCGLASSTPAEALRVTRAGAQGALRLAEQAVA